MLCTIVCNNVGFFLVAGGIMQTEEIVRCAQPILELDASKSFDRLASPFYQNNNKVSSPIDSTKLAVMAVKQEPHADENHNRDPNSIRWKIDNYDLKGKNS